MAVTTTSLKKHFKAHQKSYGIVIGTTVLCAVFGAAASEYFGYGHTASNALMGAGAGLLLGSTQAISYDAEH